MGEVESTRRDHLWRLQVRNMAGILLNRVIGSDLLWLRITRMKPSSESEGTHLGKPGGA